jgi:hypothetical protein
LQRSCAVVKNFSRPPADEAIFTGLQLHRADPQCMDQCALPLQIPWGLHLILDVPYGFVTSSPRSGLRDNATSLSVTRRRFSTAAVRPWEWQGESSCWTQESAGF